METISFETGRVISPDGTTIGFKKLGSGPGLLIIHGGFRASQHYLVLANELAGDFTVYIMDRRGRNESGPQGNNYSMEKEFEDALAILQKHEIPFVFGHSLGALVALNIALRFPLQRIAVYEPGVSVNDSLPLQWLPRFEKELAQNDTPSAMLTLIRGLKMGGPLNWLPRFLTLPMVKKLAEGNPEWKTNETLLRLFPTEVKAIKKMASDTDRYRKLSLPVLLLSGSRSPRYLVSAAEILKTVIPGSNYRSLKGLGHNAPDEDSPKEVAKVLLNYFESAARIQ